MINLLPPIGHHAVKQEYLFRVTASILLLFSFIAIFLTIAFVPTYVLVGAQIKAFEGVDGTDAEKETLRSAEAEMQTAEDILKQLGKSTETLSHSLVIQEIQKMASSEIDFKTFRIDSTKDDVVVIQVQGIAETRESLAQYKIALESAPLFEKAEIPISDLAKETNLPFSITITPKKLK